MNPQTLPSSFNKITIILKGSGGEKVISLSGNGKLFSVENNVTLVLDSNITLQGHHKNNICLVEVISGGALEMKADAKIIGNNSGGSGSVSGGGVAVYGGSFTMNGGIISGNTASYYGGGVYVNSGAFTMRGGTISGNSAVNTNSGGGGVYVNSGAFTMSGGTISGNTAIYGGGVFVSNGAFHIITGTVYGSNEATSLSNTASGNGAALFVSASGTAQRGTLSDTTWTSKATLGTANPTVKIQNGDVQP